MANNHSQTLVIIGTGLAGYLFAKAWRRLDAQTPLIMITQNDGAFYSKPMLSVAMAQHKTPDDLVTADATKMADELQATIITQTQVTSIDAKQRLIHCGADQTIAYRKLVLACGAQPLHAGIEGAVDQAILSVNQLSDYRQFRTWLLGKKHIAILGSGLVGTEFAHELAEAGFKVSVISLDAQPLARFIPSKSGELLKQQLHQRCGIDWHFNRTLQTIEAQKAGDFQLHLSDQSSMRVDGVVSAVGLRANMQLAKQIGLATNQGIVVGNDLASSDPHIYALGDCAEVDGDWRCFVAPIRYCSEVLAKNLAANDHHERVHYPPMMVMLKTPRYPLSFSTHPSTHLSETGTWSIAQENETDQLLEYRNADKQLCRFVVTGIYVKERMRLLKTIKDRVTV